MLDFTKTMIVSAAGMRAQGQRMRVVAENLANAASLPNNSEIDPYRRKVITFKNELDRESGLTLVRVGDLRESGGEFEKRYDPGHPGADQDGYVKVPNVNSLIEMMDMREAQRSYEANLNVIEAAKRMLMRTIDLLRD